MAYLYGRNWTRDEVRSRIGNVEQLCGIERVVLDDGPARGVHAAILRTGTGLEVEVLLDRAMDLGRASFNGQALAYRAPGGDSHPAFYDAAGLNWLRTFGVGLLGTCGMQNVGSPSEDEGRAHGLHGGLSATPAHDIGVESGWEGSEYRFRLTGRMREVTPLGLFGPNLCLTRSISGVLGGNTIEIQDTVENEGFTAAPLMLLYHFNLGFPLLDQGGQLVTASAKVTPRDATAEAGLKGWSQVEAPKPGYAEQVFFHEMKANEKGWARAMLVAPQRSEGGPLALCLEYDAKALPRFIQWKQLGSGVYVMGLEPANCLVLGRAAERKAGALQMLSPGEKRVFSLRLHVFDRREDIARVEGELQKA
jgi:hypothetical protein